MGVSSSAVQRKDQYFLQKVKLGQGAFGTVWRAVDRKTNEVVAVKKLEKAKFESCGVERADIDREIAIMQVLHHSNITRLFQSFEDEQFIYLALEYCEGGDFGDKVRERSSDVQELEVAAWMRQICAAILCMHSKSICHRDVKPDNFMLAAGGTLKLADFGLAFHVPKDNLLTLKCGTPAYMSPEQHKLPFGQGYGLPVDMWAAGVTMCMVLMGGRHPFINEKKELEDKLLLDGSLEFRPKHTFVGRMVSGISLSAQDSEEARQVCKAMVEPDSNKRVTAFHALRIPWLMSRPAGGTAGLSPPATRDAKLDGDPAPLRMSCERKMGRSHGVGMREAASGVAATARMRLRRVSRSREQ